MSEEKVMITTADGDCPAWVFTPEGGGRHPAAIMYTDAFGIRPASLEMGRRLADHGYVVLVPDLFYRVGDYGPFAPKEVMASPDGMAVLTPLTSSTDNLRAASDSEAFLDYLASRDDVAGPAVGVTGYCMGGAIALTVAGTYPERVRAAAAFHAGRLAIDSELSPSRVMPNITGRVYVGGSDHDQSYPPEMQAEVDRVLTEAGVDHRLEIYPEVRHGFTQTDFPVYDEAAAERHWSELFTLFDEELPQPA